MVADEYDEVTYAKILAAAEEIRAMARHRPAQAAAMFAQAHHLFELAEQIRSDWLRHRGQQAGDRPGMSERDSAGTGNGLRNGYARVRVVHSPD